MCPKGAREGGCISCCCLDLADTSLLSGTLNICGKSCFGSLKHSNLHLLSVLQCSVHHYGFESCLNIICGGVGLLDILDFQKKAFMKCVIVVKVVSP